MKKILLAVLLLGSLAPLVSAQQALMPIPRQQFFDSNGNPLAGGLIFTYAAGTTNPLPTYTDSSGLIQQTNPIVLDAGGFPPNGTAIWLGPSFYNIVVQNSNGVQQWTQDNISSTNLPFLTTFNFIEGTIPGGQVGNCLLYGVAASHRLGFNCNNGTADLVVGQQTIDTLFNKTLVSAVLHNPSIDTPSFSGTFDMNIRFMSAASVNNTLHVGGSVTAYAGADIGGQINAAYAALPAPGGEIDVDAKADGSCYNYSTPIVFATINKLVNVRSNGGACLNFTPTSGAAITVDYVGIGFLPASKHGFENLHLINNNCSTSQGCGGTAIGILVGNTNQGQLDASMISDTIQGFAVGYQNINPLSVQIQWYAPTIISGITGMNLGGLTGFELNGGTIAGNQQAIVLASSGQIEMSIFGTQFFSNISAVAGIIDATGVVGTPAAVDCHDCHFEMQPSAGEHMVAGNVDLHMFGGLIVDDNLSAGVGDWFFNLSGNAFDIYGTEVLCGRTTMTQAFLVNAPVRSRVYPYMGNNRCTAVVGGPNVTRATIGAYSSSAFAPLPYQIESALALTENGVAQTPVALQEVCYANSSTHSFQCSYNGGPFMTLAQVVTATLTTTAAASDVVTVTGMTTTGHCSLEPTNAGAAGGIASVFISAKAANQITVSHTATAAWTFDVVCTPQ